MVSASRALAVLCGLSLAQGLVRPNATAANRSSLPPGSGSTKLNLAKTASLTAGGSVGTHLQLCDCDGQQCQERYWELPADDWASTCDTLGDIGGDAAVCLFRFTAETSALVQLMLYTDIYCTGDAVEAASPWAGQFNANEHEGWYRLQQPQRVRSVRPTVVVSGAALSSAARSGQALSVGVKMVMWPLYDQDAQVGTPDEFDCAVSNPGVNVNVNGNFWPQDCVSPVDRVWCVAVDAEPNSAEDWGSVDHLDGLDFADNTQQARLFDGDTGSGFPMGSVMVNKYTSSWTGHAACSPDPNAMPPAGRCVVTKLYGITCGELTGCDSDCNLGAWDSGRELYTLREGDSINSGGGDGPWPVAIRCAWTRVVSC